MTHQPRPSVQPEATRGHTHTHARQTIIKLDIIRQRLGLPTQLLLLLVWRRRRVHHGCCSLRSQRLFSVHQHNSSHSDGAVGSLDYTHTPFSLFLSCCLSFASSRSVGNPRPNSTGCSRPLSKRSPTSSSLSLNFLQLLVKADYYIDLSLSLSPTSLGLFSTWIDLKADRLIGSGSSRPSRNCWISPQLLWGGADSNQLYRYDILQSNRQENWSIKKYNFHNQLGRPFSRFHLDLPRRTRMETGIYLATSSYL